MSGAAIVEWDNEYARLARAVSQLRTTGLRSGTTGGNGTVTSVGSVAAVQGRLQRLQQTLDDSNLHLPSVEIQRRKRLVQHLIHSTNQASTGTFNPNEDYWSSTMSATGSGVGESKMALAMRQQDDMIDQLAVGVGRLKTQTGAIHEEARMHVNLLNEMDNNLDAAHASLEDETRRAARIKEDQSVWRLQMIVAGLTILLVLLVLAGLS